MRGNLREFILVGLRDFPVEPLLLYEHKKGPLPFREGAFLGCFELKFKEDCYSLSVLHML